MHCPFCQHKDSRVVDSRLAREGRAIRRRRECSECLERFTTYEHIELNLLDVEKRNGQLEAFDRQKLFNSLRIACKKRPISQELLFSFAEKLESQFSLRPKRHIKSAEIGEAVMAHLKALDPVAYVRYASVYRSFDSVESFMNELKAFEARAEERRKPNASPISSP